MRKSALILNKFIQFLLMEIISVSIVSNIFPAFGINPKLSSNLGLIILYSALPLLILTVCFFSKKSSLISASIGIILTIIAAIFANSRGIFSNFKNFEFYYSFYIIILITVILTFIAPKFRIALIILFAAASITFASLTVLAYSTNWIFLCIFLTAVALLYTFNFYYKNIKISHTKNIMPLKYTLIAGIFCVICIVSSFGIYSIVQSRNLPVRTPSILSNAEFLELGKKYGFATIVQAPQEEESQSIGTEQFTTGNTNNNSNEKLKKEQATVNKNPEPPAQQKQPSVNNTKEGKNQQQPPADNKERPKPQQPPSSPPPAANKNPGEKKNITKFNAITYFKKFPIIFILVSIISILILIFLFKKIFRTLWYRKLLKTDRKNQIIQLYSNTLRILSIFGYKRNVSNTPIEFADKLCSSKDTIRFDKHDFKDITNIFTKVNYGDMNLTNEDYNKMISFYKSILSYCRKDAGIFKFAIRYIVL